MAPITHTALTMISDRERDVVALLAAGPGCVEIAPGLQLSKI
ncbi:hypothetical protein [Salinibacterium sp.]|nr:hypothetical protein [Salinibacterium sp.]